MISKRNQLAKQQTKPKEKDYDDQRQHLKTQQRQRKFGKEPNLDAANYPT
jgi:hypothetical protein